VRSLAGGADPRDTVAIRGDRVDDAIGTATLAAPAGSYVSA
jgi:hypothetical protein